MAMDLSKLKKLKMPQAAMSDETKKKAKEAGMPSPEGMEEEEALDLDLLAPIEEEESSEAPDSESEDESLGEVSETVGHDLAEVSDDDLMAELKARGLSKQLNKPSPLKAAPAMKAAPKSL